GKRLRRGRTRLHHGVRHHPAHQLRPRRSGHDRRHGGFHRDQRARAGGLPPLVVVLVGTACAIPVCMLVGYSMERLAYRPLRSAPRLAPLITAIGVSILLQHLAMLVWSRNVLAFPQIINTTSYTLGGAS